MTVTGWDPLCDTDWPDLLAQEFEDPYWAKLQNFVQQERSHYDVYPPGDQVFAAMCLTRCADTKVVIVGQDPYARPCQANGLAFAVPVGVKKPQSLVNIHKELLHDVGVAMPDHGSLEPWARNGVLLLNATLTVRRGESRSHQDMGWEVFTDAVVRLVREQTDPVFILWGKRAQKKKKKVLTGVSRHAIIESPHPSPLSARTGFFESHPFSKANESLVKAGRGAIDWSLPPALR